MAAISDFVSWLTAQRTGSATGGHSGGPEEYGPGCCGPDSLFHRAVREVMKHASKRVRKSLFDALKDADPWLTTIGRRCGDLLLVSRCKALAATLRAQLDDSSFAGVAELFEKAWAGDRTVSTSLAPPADDPLLAHFGSRLPLDRLGGWMVYDVLSRFVTVPPALQPVAEETAFLIVSNGAGAVRKLVVEWLPGPLGLVTPDWWPMGLIRFPQTDDKASTADELCRDTGFVESTQRVLSGVATRLTTGRLRWRVEAYRPTENPGVTPISGRSAEAAVVCAGLAVCERLTSPELAVLNPNVCITAVVEGDDADVTKRTLGTVNSETVADKFRAAAEAGIPEVLAAKVQKPDPLPKPLVSARPGEAGGTELLSHRIGTVDEAYLEIVLENRYVKLYKSNVASDWEAKWEEVDG